MRPGQVTSARMLRTCIIWSVALVFWVGLRVLWETVQ